MIEKFNHFVFMFQAAVHALQIIKTLDVQCSKSALFKRSNIASGTFYPHYLRFFPGKRIGCHHFAGGISSTVISKAKVCAQ